MKKITRIMTIVILFYTFLIMLGSVNRVNAHWIVYSADRVSVDVNGNC